MIFIKKKTENVVFPSFECIYIRFAILEMINISIYAHSRLSSGYRYGVIGVGNIKYSGRQASIIRIALIPVLCAVGDEKAKLPCLILLNASPE